ncbi:hypothetical protein N6H14_20135 [Paenibacillus sp. CC-CFT747]|nr:hypothetical protein N6H14_20135 [Paenibacillus sp. CC-CFT747]
MKEILVVSFSVGIEAYGYHALEVLQTLTEQREAGETGVRSINARMGESVWEAADRQEWPEDLMLEALRTYPDVSLEKLREKEPAPVLFEIDYEDGTKGYVVHFLELVQQWGFAFRTVEGTTAAARCNSELERPFGHFETFTRLIEEFILTRKPPFPIERTLMTTGMIDLAMESLYLGKRLETPELSIHYGKGNGRDTCQAGREEGKDGR